MARTFEIARRENVWLRMLLMSPDGGGKTKGALEVASKLFDGTLPIVGLDSEHDRMKLYADQYRFHHSALVNDHSPEAYIEAMIEAERQFPGAVLIIDSISHEWMGTGGVLQQADRFGDWKTVRPKHTGWIEAILGLQMHVICTVRLKTKYEVSTEEVNGRQKQIVSKLGLGPIQDDQISYNFDVVGRIDLDTHETTFSNRCEPLVDKTMSLIPGDDVATILTSWLSEGDPPEPVDAANQEDVDKLIDLLTTEGFTTDKIDRGFSRARRENRGVLTVAYVAEQIAKAEERLKAKQTPPAEPTESKQDPVEEGASA